ncbi:MAG: M48 family metalloprotease, partial [Elusimicrobiota bacterium]
MFFKIPAETYLEIQTASRRKTKFLLFFLVVIYFIFFFLLFEVTRLFAPHLFSFSFDLGWLEKLILILTFSFLISYIHFKKTVDTIIPGLPYLLGAKNPDPDDFYHKTFSNVVSELSNATGIYNIRSGIMPSTSTNAFSISNGKNYNFVCTTEGLLARLNRNELEAVMAHEFSHILNGDSVLATIACSLFSIFEQILENTKKKNLGLLYKLTSRRFYLFRLYLVILRLLCYIAIFLGQIVTIFISRQRELLADATAVKLTRNPLGLAEA